MKTLYNLLFLVLLFTILYACQKASGQYVCPPCDLFCDTIQFTHAGKCPHCHMDLIQASELREKESLVLNEIKLEEGSGEFLISGGLGREDNTIRVFYHRPKGFSAQSRILWVIPGAGRNGDSYRDAWIEESEKYNVLVLCPKYAEKEYDYSQYHLGGIVYDHNFMELARPVQNTNQIQIDDEALRFKVQSDPQKWIFADFDRIFDAVVEATKSKQSTYDIFGHSAGGQILHRLALFYPQSKAETIIAGNSGTYTLVNFQDELPFGLKGSLVQKEELKKSFAKKLILWVGELDNANETKGKMLRSSQVDKQGTHRLARGQYFFAQAKQMADSLNYPFAWELHIVPGVGHNHRKMGDAAGIYLYE